MSVDKPTAPSGPWLAVNKRKDVTKGCLTVFGFDVTPEWEIYAAELREWENDEAARIAAEAVRKARAA